jgi:uncharacterized protein involved in exopolysaccharide biosynthesis
MGHLVSPRALLRVIWRRLFVILLIVAIGFPLSVWFALSRPKLFEATAVIQIEAPEVAEQLAGQAMLVNSNSQLDLIQQKLMSRDNMIAVIDRFGLFEADMPVTEKVFLLRESVTIIELVDPSQSWRPDVQASGLVITVRLDDAQKAADVANDFLASILSEAQARSEGRAARTLDFFVAEEARVSEEISQIEAIIAEFKQVNTDSLPDNIASQRDRLTRLTDSLIGLDQQLIELQTQSDRLREDELQRQITLLEQQRSLIAGNIATIEASIAAAPVVERRLSALNRQLDQLNTEYELVTQRRTEAAMTQLLEEQDQAERFEVLETAIPPEYPVSASRRKIAMAGGVATVALALAVAVLLEVSSGKIRTAAQLERQLGVRPVIIIPNLTTRETRRQRRITLIAALFALIGVIWALLRRFGSEIIALLPLQRDSGDIRTPLARRGA